MSQPTPAAGLKGALAVRWQAIVCALLVPFCALLIHPHVELGIIDDFAYIRMVKIFAQTGHFVYNGWPSAMIGPLIVAAALAVKIFGFSFTVVRSVVVVCAALTGFLMQRLLVRAGLLSWNATVATFALLLSPLFLPLAFTFMTDVPGVFGIVACLYLTVRALQSSSSAAAIAFLALTSVVSVLAGACRQTAWLGVLVMVPSAMFLLRRHREILMAGVGMVAAGALAIRSLLHWLQHQPYSRLPERLIEYQPHLREFINLAQGGTRFAEELAFLLIPILVAFLPAVSLRNRRSLMVLGGLCVACLGYGLVKAHSHLLLLQLGPYLRDWFTPVGAADGFPILGARPVILGTGVRSILTVAMLAGLFSVAAILANPRGSRPAESPLGTLSWHQLGWLLIPFTTAYCALHVSRALFESIFDRYTLPLMVVALLVLVRFYQETVAPRLPVWSFVAVLLAGGYAVATTHDLFALYRAKLAAIDEALAGGVPATEIDGGFEYDGWNQIDQTGYTVEPVVNFPAGVVPPPPPDSSRFCKPYKARFVPSLSPRVALSMDPNACAGSTDFAPVRYHPWIGPGTANIYVVKEPESSSPS